MFRNNTILAALALIGLILFSCTYKGIEDVEKVKNNNVESSEISKEFYEEESDSPTRFLKVKDYKEFYDRCKRDHKARRGKLVNVCKFYRMLKYKYVRGGHALFANDVSLEILGREGTVPFAGSYEGKNGILRFLINYFLSVRVLDVETQYNIVDSDRNKISSHINMIGYVYSTDETFDLEFTLVYDLDENSRIKRIRVFYDTYTFYSAFTEGGPQYNVDLKGTDNYEMYEVPVDVEDYIFNSYLTFLVFGDLAGTLPLMSTELNWTLKGAQDVPIVGEFIGYDGFTQWAVAIMTNEIFISYSLVDENLNPTYEAVAEDNRIDFIMSEAFIAIPTNEEIVIDFLHTWRLTPEGLIGDFKSYNDTYDIWEGYEPD